MKIKTLKNYFRISMITITFAIFILFYAFSSYLHTALTIKENKQLANAVSEQVFGSMYQVMRQGWSRGDLEEFIASTQDSFEKTSYDVDIYRGEIVEELYGTIDQDTFSKNVKGVFDTGMRYESSDDASLKLITPMKAGQECLQCHTNAKVGDVLGVVSIDYDFSQTIKDTQFNYLLFSLIILPLMFLITYLLSKHLLRKIDDSIGMFNKKIKNINSVKDFKNLDTSNVKQSFSEFETMMTEVTSLSQKLKNIAVDKDILEFEVKLLDKLIITSEVVKDWKEYIKELLGEINHVLPVYCLITIFKTEDEVYEVEIFWLGEPEAHIKKYLEDLAQTMITEHHHVTTTASVNHTVVNKNSCLNSIATHEIEHEAKSLLLDAPKIGGIVGLGIQADTSKDSVYHIVIDSILTTLLNLVGSVKAIHKYTENLEFYATRDPLTGLFSQRVFRDLLDYEIKRAHSHSYEFGLLVIDCDNFKPVNDTYGHSFGDLFLSEFANLLEANKRDEDILSRYGGDEFTIVLPESGLEESYRVAQRILRAIEDFNLTAPDGTEVNVTVSIGIAIYPTHAQEATELFNIADAMMYRAKNEGKDAVRTPSEIELDEIHQESKDKSMLVLDAVKNGNIIPHFQPIMNAANNRIEINEVLMRIDLDGQTVTAGQFIQTAESLGIVHQMDYVVIEKAFAKLVETGYEGVLFINLSPKALIISEFMEKINALTHKYNIPKSRIVFEITERETVKSFAMLEKFVFNLKLEGFRFAIDDFGSGFSSFHYIKKFPIDFVKIDGDFIVNIHKDEKDYAFVKSIISLAHELGIKTIAEFVEDDAVLQFLKEVDIDYVQGFHIARPS
ncbi:MAG: putative bifunctional diguanylate cyclase/phosphodiesterase, partial [Campylobacterota bacterium]